MKTLAAEEIEVSRVLLNLGHSYIRNNSSGNSENGESTSVGPSTTRSTTRSSSVPGSSVYDVQHTYNAVCSTAGLFSTGRHSPTNTSVLVFSFTLTTGSLTSTNSSPISNNILSPCFRAHSHCPHICPSLCLYDSSGGKKRRKCGACHLETPTKKSDEFKRVQREFNKNLQLRDIELVKKQPQFYAGIRQSNEKVLNEFDAVERQRHGDVSIVEIKLHIQMQMDSGIRQELDVNVRKEFGEKRQIAFENDLGLNIEMQQEPDEKSLSYQFGGEERNANEITNRKILGIVDEETRVEKRVTYENLQEFELETQRTEDKEKFNHKIQHEIKKLVIDVLNLEQAINRDTQQNLMKDGLPVELITEIKQNIEQLQREIEALYSSRDVDLEQKIIINIEMLNMDLKTDRLAYTSSLKIQEKSTTVEMNGCIKLLTWSNNSVTYVVQEKLDSIPKMPSSSIQNTYISSLSELKTKISLVLNAKNGLSSVSSSITTMPSEPNHFVVDGSTNLNISPYEALSIDYIKEHRNVSLQRERNKSTFKSRNGRNNFKPYDTSKGDNFKYSKSNAEMEQFEQIFNSIINSLI